MTRGGIAGIRSKGDNRRALIFRFKGSTRDFINPVESLIQDVYTTQSRVEINRVIKSTGQAGPRRWSEWREP